MLTAPAPLLETARALRNSKFSLLTYINQTCDRIDAIEPHIHALLPEPDRHARLLAKARTLQARFPRSTDRPPLYGILLGIKDVFAVDGFTTRAGSQLPPELFKQPEAVSVTRLREAGALILGKTVSTEFAWFEPGPTRNPHNPQHTPGGSSSGSAAAVAAGFCPLALGTQTVGSVIRPAAFCGIVGFKPSYGRIPTSGVVPCASSLDTVGFFTQNVVDIALVAPLLCERWQSVQVVNKPVLGVPDGPYLALASPEALRAFETQLTQLEQAGYQIRHIPVLSDIETIQQQHMRLVFAEMALQHHAWFTQYESLYRPRTVTAIRDGQHVSTEALEEARTGRIKLRETLEAAMRQHSIDLWICPAAPGAAPEGITTTGSPAMNLPWTYAGLPVITFPVGTTSNNLPLGLQCIGAFMADEALVSWAQRLQQAFSHK
jgi:Asp-tRNA(Asn)/Glu-tRNA(Gln) amidotransferase A subunit family amidase